MNLQLLNVKMKRKQKFFLNFVINIDRENKGVFMTKKIIYSVILVSLVVFFIGCNLTTNNNVTVQNVTEVKLTYKDESDNDIKTVSYNPKDGITIEKVTVGNIEYEGYYKNGNKKDFVFFDEKINDSSDVVLKAKWIKSSYYEMPVSTRINTDEAFYKDHKFYKNKYGNEFYDSDTRTTWITTSTVTVY